MFGAETGSSPLRVAIACATPAALLALAVLLPFLGKAFTGDDLTFLLQAQHVLTDPLHPTAFEMVVEGVRTRLSAELVSGPIMAYLLAPSVLLGRTEWAAHAIQIIFVIITLVATAALALRLGLDRVQATIAPLLLVASPAVLGMAATAMPDVPAMAFAIAGIERILAWKESPRNWTSALASAGLLALAALSRPQVLLIFFIAALLLMDDAVGLERRLLWRKLWRDPVMIPLVLGLAFVALVIYVTRDPASGATVAIATLNRAHWKPVLINLGSFPLHWVVMFPLGIAWPVLRGSHFLQPRRTFVSLLMGLALGLFGPPGGHWWSWLLVLLCIGLGIDVLADILYDAWVRRDKTQLVLGSWLLIGLAAAWYIQLPAKLLLPSAPAMALLLARQMYSVQGARIRATVLAFVGIVGVVIGILIIRADEAWAEIGREGGRVAAQQVRAGRTVWIDGASGFQWYGLAAGGRALATTRPLPKEGDVVIASLYSKLLRTHFPHKTLIYRRVFAEPGGRMQSEGAGFFTNWQGRWPWVWGHEEFGRIEMWRIDSSSEN